MRRIAAYRQSSGVKAQLVKELLSPTVEAALGSRGRGGDVRADADVYRYVKNQIHHVSERIETSWRLLHNAHDNLAGAISLQIAYSSKNTSQSIKKLMLISVLIFPPSLVGNLWGMNVGVPWHQNLGWYFYAPFIGITSVLGGYTVIVGAFFFLPPLFRWIMRRWAY
jgi:Mg2+ and Co2+ transporter CorA